MKAQLTHHLLTALLGVVFTAELSLPASPVTYQGRLAKDASPANGNYDLRCTLYESANGSAEVAGGRGNPRAKGRPVGVARLGRPRNRCRDSRFPCGRGP